MRAPRIAITRTRRPDDYLTALRLAGATPLLVEPADGVNPRELLARVDGLLLSGGGDVAPHFYGETPHPTYRPAEPGRDDLEIELAVRAIERDVPVLGICRGLQVLNVALGGTLLQDIRAFVPRALRHHLDSPLDALAHEVEIVAGSRLAGLVGRGTRALSPCPVNSRHHQAIRRVAPSLVVVASARDGVIEGIERPGSTFCVGVQWHPENYWRDGRFGALFEGFVAAARRP